MLAQFVTTTHNVETFQYIYTKYCFYTIIVSTELLYFHPYCEPGSCVLAKEFRTITVPSFLENHRYTPIFNNKWGEKYQQYFCCWFGEEFRGGRNSTVAAAGPPMR